MRWPFICVEQAHFIAFGCALGQLALALFQCNGEGWLHGWNMLALFYCNGGWLHGWNTLAPALGPVTDTLRLLAPENRNIKTSNAAFQQRVAAAAGGVEFLELCGFKVRSYCAALMLCCSISDWPTVTICNAWAFVCFCVHEKECFGAHSSVKPSFAPHGTPPGCITL